MSRPLRVCSFESRRADEMQSLIERNHAVATVVESLREIPLGMTPQLEEFLSCLRSGAADVVIFMTGVGAESLVTAMESKCSREEFFRLLQQASIVVRGPKPWATLRKWGVRIDARADEPNTWREVVQAVLAVTPSRTDLTGRRICVQEYGLPSSELYAELAGRGAEVVAVPVYRWALPEDTLPLEQVIRDTVSGVFDLILLTTGQQLVHTLQVADLHGLRAAWLAAVRRCVVASIGPTTSQQLVRAGLPVDFEPAQPHMGQLVRGALAAAPGLLPDCRIR